MSSNSSVILPDPRRYGDGTHPWSQLSREALQARTGARLRFAAACGVLLAPDIADED